jgi:hypothetical protein
MNAVYNRERALANGFYSFKTKESRINLNADSTDRSADRSGRKAVAGDKILGPKLTIGSEIPAGQSQLQAYQPRHEGWSL